MGKKAVSAGAFLLLSVFLMAAGCGSREQSDSSYQTAFPEPVYDWGKSTGETLVIWGIYPEMERSYIVKAFERYRSLTGNELEVVQIPKEEFEEKLFGAVEGETERPDILLSYGGTNIDIYDPDENFYDFTEAGWVEDLTDTAINQAVYNGKIIGLPHWEASVSGTIYNKEIFRKYHLEVPKTQEEFLQTCETLKNHGVIPLYMPGKEISMLLYQFPLDSVVEDISVLEGLNDGRLGYADIPQMEQIVMWYRIMAEKEYLGDNYMEDDWNGMNEAMESGRYAMMLCWDTWLYTDFEGDASRFGLMPAFMGVPQEGTFEGPNLGMFLVNKNSERLDAALNFITFLADPYNYNAAFEGIYTAPVFKNQIASISTPQYLEAESVIERHFFDSIAWLRIRGFSQMDASCILEFMESGSGMTAQDCLRNMDRLRAERMQENPVR